jgi:hypothetical protein
MNPNLTPPYPQGGAISFPALNQRGNTPAVSEFDQASWRSLVATLGRINLNRPLTPFPPPIATTTTPTVGVFPAPNQTQALQALQDRQQFALDIFTRLVQVTTGYPTPAPACSAAYTIAPIGQSTQYQALRYLAQLSANIVDYIDTDDQSTPFNWYNPTTPGQTAPIPEWVFGTETPRALINEGYIQLDNNSTPAPASNGATPPVYSSQANLNVNVWLELFNPMLPDPVSTTALTGTEDTTAWLESIAAAANGTNPTAIPATNLYQILLVNPAAQSTLALPGNTAGNPNYLVATPTTGNNIYSTVSTFPSTNGTSASVIPSWGTIPPLNPPALTPPAKAGTNVPLATAPQGFYVIGPTAGTNFLPNGPSPETPARTYQTNPTVTPFNLPVSFESANMTYTVPNTNTPTTVPPPIVLLQRLACPLLPANPNMASPTYNPFITIDSFTFQQSQINDSRYYTTTGPNTPTVMTKRVSYGRMQPFANNSQVAAQNPPAPSTTQPLTTFFSHNSPLTNGFAWNTHLDRTLISPVELLFVHGARPMDLTA